MTKFRLLRRTLTADPSRLGLSVLAVSAAIVLIIILEGFKVGLYQQIRSYPTSLNVPLIATQAGVENMTGARSIIPLHVAGKVEQVKGVAAVHPLVGVPLVYESGDRKTPIYVVAYQRLGGPPSITEGRAIENPKEIVIDRALARKHSLNVGDDFVLAGFSFRVAGLAGGPSNVFNPFVFIRLSDALELYTSAPEHLTQGKVGVSFLLIEMQPGVELSAVRAGIERAAPEVDVLTPEQLGANDVKMAGHMLGGVLTLLISVAYIIGVLVIGLTLFASVFEKLREFGVMKALGATNAGLYQIVISQSLFVVSLSSILGLLIGLVSAQAIEWAAPQYLVVPWHAVVVVRTAAAALGMALIAALLPIRQVSHVDPMLVFKG